ncbi:MAG: DUF1641 domain-containing protein [Candidatus Pristimantibacillus sp.]
MSETVIDVAVTDKARELDVLEQLLKPEIQQSLNELVANLPKLTEMVALLTKTYDVAQTVVNDKVLMNDTVGGITDFVMPVVDKAKGIASAAIEANDRAQQETTATIGLFGLLKMLKDPNVQQTFRFAQSFLDVLSERQKKN